MWIISHIPVHGNVIFIPPPGVFNWSSAYNMQSIKWDDSLELDVITLWGLTHSGCTRLERLWARRVEEEEDELQEPEASSRVEEEVEEMVRDMVLVFFCTLWMLHSDMHVSSEWKTLMSISRTSLFAFVIHVWLTVPCFRRSRRQWQRLF